MDLGQQADYSALVITERNYLPAPDRPDVEEPHFAVRHIHRWPLKTPYPVVVADVKEMYTRSPLQHSALVIDGTGVGRAVVEMFAAAEVTAFITPFSITAGQNPGEGTVPKKDLVGAIQATLSTRRLLFARDLEFTEVLVKELETFRVKVTEDRNETFAAWRERDHDDLVLALALAVWYGRPHQGNPRGCYGGPPAGTTPFDSLPAGTFTGGRRAGEW